ncbi:MAG: hypothetical protein DRH90_05470 [Deltaproteobacteria bacterium]|nr:MAG: hypothetical protein DRH90_05470 [Deltaproteobacteria bacterium]RLC16771.1 MAG: hypothetical protein DRI24_07515 [Deltaproteobacteria bacterium]HHE74621.1 hypothetical protein [Desulfobacteraceae bacterium]
MREAPRRGYLLLVTLIFLYFPDLFFSVKGNRIFHIDFFKKTAFVKDQSVIGAAEVVINKIMILRFYLNGFLLSVVMDYRFLFKVKDEIKRIGMSEYRNGIYPFNKLFCRILFQTGRWDTLIFRTDIICQKMVEIEFSGC